MNALLLVCTLATAVETPAERLRALIAEHDPAPRTLIGDYAAFAAASRPFLALADEHPDDPAAFDALAWVATMSVFKPENGEAMERLGRRHRDDPKLAAVLARADILCGDPFGPLRDLARAASSSENRDVRGVALMALAHDLMAEVAKADRDAGELLLLGGVGPGRPEAELDPLTVEAAETLRRVVAEYADVVDPTPRTEPIAIGAQAEADLRQLDTLLPGDPAPEIAGTDADGATFRLSDYRGKVVLLVFSADWCAPCVASYPRHREQVERWKDRPFALLAVDASGSLESLEKSISDGEITWRSWFDGPDPGPICDEWNVRVFPTCYVIDHRGVIRLARPINPRAIDAQIELFLAEAEAEGH